MISNLEKICLFFLDELKRHKFTIDQIYNLDRNTLVTTLINGSRDPFSYINNGHFSLLQLLENICYNFILSII